MLSMRTFTVLILFIAFVNGSGGDGALDVCRTLQFRRSTENKVLENHVIRSLEVPNEDTCQFHCFEEPDCVSINYGATGNGKQLCELNDHSHLQASSDYFVARNGYIYRSVLNFCLSNPCSSNATCQTGFTSKRYRCICPKGYEGPQCESDIDECSTGSHNCSIHASCTNIGGSFECTCNQGYTGDGSRCSAVNHCSDATPVTGIHWILGFGVESFPVYCDQTTDEGGWTMVFKAVGGVASPQVATLWESSNTSESNQAALDTTLSHNLTHYKNRLVENWEVFNPTEARVVLFSNGVEVKSLKFSAVGSNKINWFSKQRLLSSPWNDLNSSSILNSFGIRGAHSPRSFEISKAYVDCPLDLGWLVISASPGCAWETRLPPQSVLYSKIGTAAVWSEYATIGVAEVLAVFIR